MFIIISLKDRNFETNGFKITRAPCRRHNGEAVSLTVTLADLITVNTTHPEPEIHEHVYRTTRLRNNVYNFMHILNNAERNVTKNVNNAAHTDELTV